MSGRLCMLCSGQRSLTPPAEACTRRACPAPCQHSRKADRDLGLLAEGLVVRRSGHRPLDVRPLRAGGGAADKPRVRQDRHGRRVPRWRVASRLTSSSLNSGCCWGGDPRSAASPSALALVRARALLVQRRCRDAHPRAGPGCLARVGSKAASGGRAATSETCIVLCCLGRPQGRAGRRTAATIGPVLRV